MIPEVVSWNKMLRWWPTLCFDFGLDAEEVRWLWLNFEVIGPEDIVLVEFIIFDCVTAGGGKEPELRDRREIVGVLDASYPRLAKN
ncbi:hypothetical protein LINPERPRIM_LOCUS5347 [Linum perenne]